MSYRQHLAPWSGQMKSLPRGLFRRQWRRLGLHLRLQVDCLATTRSQFKHHGLAEQAEDGAAVFVEDLHPIPPLHLGKINAPECQPAEEVDKSIRKGL